MVAKICIKVVPGDWESPVLAVLDTGADCSVINTEIAEDLGLGYSGLLERIRFAVDPPRNDFFFGPLG